MSKWAKVGEWIKDNAGTGAALVGSMLTGNVAGAVASGVALVSSATGSDDPVKALEQLQSNPETLLKLKQLTIESEKSIREHIESMHRLNLEDAQHEHKTTQDTIRSGDNAEDPVVRRTRPLQSWLALVSAILYAFLCSAIEAWEFYVEVMLMLMVLPYSYFGLREIGKGIINIVNKRLK